MSSFNDHFGALLLLDLPTNRRLSYGCFGLALATTLATQQFGNPVKQAIFFNVVGSAAEPIARTLVLVVLIPLLVVYSGLVGCFRNARVLVGIICGTYAAVFVSLSYAVHQSSGNPAIWLVYVLYYATETRTVIIMPMIWSVVADVSTVEYSKKAYATLFGMIQLGGILGSLVAIGNDSFGGEAGLILAQAVVMCLVALLVAAACVFAERDQELESSADEVAPLLGNLSDSSRPAQDAATGGSSSSTLGRILETMRSATEGPSLLLTRPFVFLIFWVSYAFLMPRTVIEYENTVLIVEAFVTREAQVAYMGKLNLYGALMTTFIAFVGTRGIVAAIGVGGVLMLLPVVAWVVTAVICIHHTLAVTSAAIVLSTAVAFALNSPCKEMLFVHTSRDIKYKAKSWSEMYGNHIMKAFGAQVNFWLNRDKPQCHPNCFQSQPTAVVVSIWCFLWLCAACHEGRLLKALERDGKIVT